jgi:hypothetical protein
VVPRGNKTLDPHSGHPAHHRHQELEQAEVEGQAESRARAAGLAGRATTQGYRTRVHSQPQGDQYDFK